MAAKEKVSTINTNFINNVTIRSINLPPSLQLTDQCQGSHRKLKPFFKDFSRTKFIFQGLFLECHVPV